ncbi:MAG: hypothetical protein WA938_00625 [Candidatus Dormiibacterota bacterium]
MKGRTGILTAVLVVVVAVGVLLTVYIPGPSASGPNPGRPEHSPYVVLTTGTYQGHAWQLFAWEEGRLCMAFLPAGYDPAHMPSVSSPVGAGQCEFEKTQNPTSSYYDGGPGYGGSFESFGPLPTDATQIRVATHEVLPTTLLPPAKGLPAGRYWINIMPAGWPTSAQGNALDVPQPLDAQGRPVQFQDF